MIDDIVAKSKTLEEIRAKDPDFIFALSIVNRTYIRGGNAILQMEDGTLVRIELS
jgi:hypothetical protein